MAANWVEMVDRVNPNFPEFVTTILQRDASFTYMKIKRGHGRSSAIIANHKVLQCSPTPYFFAPLFESIF